MAKQFIEDGEKGFIVRKKINENFSELYSNDTLWLSGKNLSLNSLTKYGNANTLLNSIVYDTGTLVGIGTNSPTDKLHVAGGNIVGYSGNLSTYTGLVVRNRSIADYTIDGRIIVDTVNTPNKVIIGSLTNHPLQIITDNAQRVWIDSSGMTTSGNLNVAGDVTITGNLSALGTTTQIDTKMYVTSAVSITNTGSGPALYVTQTGTNDIATFLDDSNTALIIKDGGKVGIGLENPSRTLSVNGTPTVNGSNRSILALMDTSPMASDIGGGLDFGGIYNFAGNYAEWAGIKGIKENAVNGDYAASLVLSTRSTSSSTSEKMRITSTGRVGIGTSAPNNTLHVVSTTLFPARLQGSNTNTTALEIYNTSSNKIWESAVAGTSNAASIPSGSYYIYEQGVAPRMTISTSGNLGIGTINPTERLTISGNLSASGDATISGNLSAFGTGTIKTVNPNTTSNDVLVLGPNNIIEKRTLTLWNAGASGLLNNGLATNYITKYGSTNDLVNSLIYDNGTSVGIGTTSPQSLLHISTASTGDQQLAQFINPNLLTNDTGYITVGGNNTAYSGTFLGFKKTGTNTGLTQLAVRGRPTLNLNENGYLGVLTETPTGALDVNGNSYFNKGRVGGSNHVTIRGFQTNQNYGVLAYTAWNGTNDVNTTEIAGLITSHTAGSESGGLTIYTRNSGTMAERVRITPDGNMGIGNSSPQGRLDVSGGFTIIRPTNDDPAGGHCVLFPRSGTDPYTNPSRLEIRLYGTESIIYNHWAGTGAVRNLTVGSGGAYHHYNGTTGNVGIGTISPSTKLHVSTTNIFPVTIENSTVAPSVASNADSFTLFKNYYGNTQISNWQNIGMRIGSRTTANGGTGHIVFTTGNDTERMRLDASGNLGIGTSSPSQKLHVVDSAASNANGNALFASTGGNASIRIDSASTSYYTYQTFSQGGAGKFEIGIVPTSSDFYINPSVQNGSTGASIYIEKSTGNVGIGTTSPVNKLDVAGTCQVNYLVVDPQDGTNEGGEIQLKGAGSYGNLQFDNYQGNLRLHTLGTSNYFEIIGGSSSSSALRISTGGAYISGLISGGSRLYIASTSEFVGNATFNNNRSSSNNHITINNNTTNYGSIAFSTYLPVSQTEVNTAGIRGIATDSTNGYGDLVFITKGSSDGSAIEKVRIYSNSNVGIGTRIVGINAPTSQNGLTVGTIGTNTGTFISLRNSSTNGSDWYDWSTGASFGTSTSKDIYFTTNNAERMRISSGGNVGIGTSVPGRIFHTNGIIRFQGLSTYANNSDAKTAGLVAGDVYRTATGELRIVF